MTDTFNEQALRYHRASPPGKIEVVPTKPLANQRDLALAYSPGVAAACDAIVADPHEVSTVTARGNLVAVITNGTAVLGLGNIGPLASKPVMEGKGVLFKKFAGIDVFDIEISESDPDKLVEIIASLEPTFGGINLEDIKAPECFYIERQLRDRMKIPVFHDDQHGTAIITAAAVINALHLIGKDIGAVKLVASGAGAAGIACLDLLVSLGLQRKNIIVCDSRGVLFQGREDFDPSKAAYAADTPARNLAEAIVDADIFLGLSKAGVLSREMVKSMAARPLILALANPTPEIMPEEAKAARPDAIIATGRSDYPNQVNNVLCFPYIFRGALDVGATTINREMQLACVRALAQLAREPHSSEEMAAYGGASIPFGPEYLIPKPFESRLLLTLPPAVARAAMESGVATHPITDFDAYRQRLSQYVYRSGMVMRPVFDRAKADRKRIIYAQGEEERVLWAAQAVIDDGIAYPVLIGRRQRVEQLIQELSLHIRPDRDFALIDQQNNPYYEDCWREYHRLRGRHGVDPNNAQIRVNTRATVVGALLLRLGHGDALICGLVGNYPDHVDYVLDIIGLREGVRTPAALDLLITSQGPLFICDTHLNENPSAEELADITLLAAEEVRRFVTPKVALLSRSNFGSYKSPQTRKMAEALAIIRQRAPDLEVEGEMRGDVALSAGLRSNIFPASQLKGEANLLIMPNVDAANISYTLLKMLTNGVAIGPIMLGLAQPAHVLTPSSTARRIINMSAIAVVDAQEALRRTD
ncbi:MAG: NADP-dependent malic enzyme [Candidatus Competibacter sp.]|nr:NADP-dependent malic enzyme [Candidatus Competibacter sp.]MDG4604890.1 NADP-dependent malic enzyme [Candidatus Contendobacter sp.]HRD50750.1 NADP-dependent malic enzyme [Candidatus Contendobacter sp.]